MNKKLFLTLVLLVTFVFALSAQFLFRNSYVVPSSMGNAYTAFINDAYSAYFNPAILPFLTNYQFATSFGSLYQMSDLSYSNFLMSRSFDNHGMAFAIDRFGFSLYRENKYMFSYGYKFSDKLSVGTNIKLLSLDIKELGSKDKLSYDVSAYYQVLEWLSLGVIGRNVNEPTLSTKVENSFQFGASLTPHDRLSMNFDYSLPPYGYSNRLLTGIQLKVSDAAFLRMGYQTKPHNISAGFGLNFGGDDKVFTFNYTYIHNQIFNYSNIVGITYHFDTFEHDFSKIAAGRFFDRTDDVDDVEKDEIVYDEEYYEEEELEEEKRISLEELMKQEFDDLEDEELDMLADEIIEESVGVGFLSLAEIERLLQIHGDISDEDLEGVVGISDFSLPEPISTEDEIWSLYFADEISEEDANLLQELIERPININEADIEDFMRLPNMTRVDAQNILDMRRVVRAFETIDDLVVLDVIDMNLFDFISPFITTRVAVSQILEYSFYFDNTLDDGRSTRMTQNVKSFIGKYTVNILADRDKGEEEIDNLLKYSIRGDGVIKDGDRLVLGNFGANFGYNMIFQKLTASQRNQINIDDSRREYGNLRGVAYNFRRIMQKDWDATFMYSRNYYEAREIDIYGGDYKFYLSNAGKSKDITENLFGTNTRFNLAPNLVVGITGYVVDYDSDTDLGENFYYNQSYVYGFDFTYVTGHGYTAYGEKAFQKGGHHAILLGFGKRGQNLTVDVNYHNNDPYYLNFQSNNTSSRPDVAAVTANVRYDITRQHRINLRLQEGREKSTDIAASLREILWQNRFNNDNLGFVEKVPNLNDFTLLLKYTAIDFDLNEYSDYAGRFYIERSGRYNYYRASATTNRSQNNYELQLRMNTNFPDNIRFKYVHQDRDRYLHPGFESRKTDNYEFATSYRNRARGFVINAFYRRFYENLAVEYAIDDPYFDTEIGVDDDIDIRRDGYYNEYRLNWTQNFKSGNRLRVNTLARRYSEWGTTRDYSQIQTSFDFPDISLTAYYRGVHDGGRNTFRIYGTIDW